MPDRRSQGWNAIHDEAATDYGEHLPPGTSTTLKVDLIRTHIGPERDVLDVGCANGLHLLEIATACRSASGVDLSTQMTREVKARAARAGLDNVQVCQASADDLPFGDQTFDLLYSFSTLLLVPDIDGAFGEIARVLRPGGTAVLDIAGRNNLSQLYWGRWYRRRGHFGVHSFTSRALAAALERHGLEIVDQTGLGFTDQWKYLPVIRRTASLARFFHNADRGDRDSKLSNVVLLRSFANRWFVTVRRPAR